MMNIPFSARTPPFLKRLVLGFISSSFFFFLSVHPCPAQNNWASYVTDLVVRLVDGQKTGSRIYVHSLRDESNSQAYYPFMQTVGKALANEIGKRGFIVGPGPTGVDCYVMTTFLERPGALFLNASLISAEDGSTVLTSASVEIPASSLPARWKERSLRDVAYELVAKLEQRLFIQKIKIVFGEFSGGHSKEESFVSEFSSAMRGYIKEEMSKSGTFVILAPSARQNGDEAVVTLKGHFTVAEEDVIFRLVLQKGLRERREIANVSARFSKLAIPHGMAIFPNNIYVASQNTDTESDETGSATGVPIQVWTNKSNGTYRNNDRLVIFLRPEEACYARVYYIQSDGAIVQVFPSNAYESGFLKKGTVYGVGSEADDVELIIGDQTTGQEFVKVFASRHPIDDASVPREFIQQANVFRIRSGYRGLQESLARSLEITKRRLLPSAEVKILVR